MFAEMPQNEKVEELKDEKCIQCYGILNTRLCYFRVMHMFDWFLGPDEETSLTE